MSDHLVLWTEFRKRRVLRYLNRLKRQEPYYEPLRRQFIDFEKLDDFYELLFSFLSHGDPDERRLADRVIFWLPEAHERVDQHVLVHHIVGEMTKGEGKTRLLESMMQSCPLTLGRVYFLILSKLDMRYLLRIVDCYDLFPKHQIYALKKEIKHQQEVFKKVIVSLLEDKIITLQTALNDRIDRSYLVSDSERSAAVSAIRRLKTHRSMLEYILGKTAYTNLSKSCAALEHVVMFPIATVLNRLTDHQNQYFGSTTSAEMVSSAKGMILELDALKTEIEKKAEGNRNDELESVLEKIAEIKEPFSWIVRYIAPGNSLCERSQFQPKQPFDIAGLRDELLSLWNEPIE